MMDNILILYATREGQTRRIAEHVDATLRSRGLQTRVSEVSDFAGGSEVAGFGAVILAASVHMGKHEKEMVRFVSNHRAELSRIPTAFLSTSMTEGAVEQGSLAPAERDNMHAEVERTIEAFFDETGFHSTAHKAVAGALIYTKYNWLVRLVMKRISRKEGVSTDTSRDHEYTDWLDLDRFVLAFVTGELVANQTGPT